MGNVTVPLGTVHTVRLCVRFISLVMDCMGFSAIVTITPCEHFHCILYNLLVAIKKNIAVAIAPCKQALNI